MEVKSGYGLDRETELRMLRVARADRPRAAGPGARRAFSARTRVPPKSGDADGYIDEVCIPTLRAAHAEGLVDAVDAFCEGIAFTPAQVARVFAAARALGLPVKVHAEQLSNLGGARLAARVRRAVGRPPRVSRRRRASRRWRRRGRSRCSCRAPSTRCARRRRRRSRCCATQGVPMAVATDCNPGSSPMASILLAMNMACTLFRLTPEEALAGATREAARALGLGDCGRIAPGLRADLAVWDAEHPAELAYRIGFNPLHERIFGGAA